MKVKRIATNVAATDISKARQFYAGILGLEVVMDQGWIMTFASSEPAIPQLSVAIEGGHGTAVPDISVEVDDLEEALRRVRVAGLPTEYGLSTKSGGCAGSTFVIHLAG
jgi:catechol 2,3-dioxygenase-like lactoylglutathione lyase family enzyme